MLTTKLLDDILAGLPRLRLGVLGDLFLDRYLDLDSRLTEPSIETGLDAYQVVRIRSVPGAAGTVMNNLAALGVGTILPISVIGDDGEGLELRRALARSQAISAEHILASPRRFTPTYTKPMLGSPGQAGRELNRLDIKNRASLPVEEEEHVLKALEKIWPDIDALAVLDQVSEVDCGVVSERVRQKLAELAQAQPDKVILADSRARIGLFRHCWLKPNEQECLKAVSGRDTREAILELARRVGRPVFCTRGQEGIWVVDPRPADTRQAGRPAPRLDRVPAFAVPGPIDTVGAGDSTGAGILCALAAGASLVQAAALGNLVASITIQQLGTTGSASPQEVRRRWQEQKQV